MNYRKEAIKTWCPECDFYEKQKCKDWSISETGICDAGYIEYLEYLVNELHISEKQIAELIGKIK